MEIKSKCTVCGSACITEMDRIFGFRVEDLPKIKRWLSEQNTTPDQFCDKLKPVGQLEVTLNA